MNRQIARTIAYGFAAALAASTAPAQVGQFENWKESAKLRAPATPCANLRSLTNYDFSIDAATLVAARTATAPDGTTNSIPEFCLVQGQVAPEVRFEISLPKDWNGRLYMFGNGGFAGEPFTSTGRVGTRDNALRHGFATAATNTGHDSTREPLASFASNPQKLVDYAYRAVHVTAMTAKTIVRAYYDAPASKSYFVGCSTGGRQGLVSAQRFPEDFDGIVVGAPVLDFTGTMVHYTVIHRALAAAPIPGDTVLSLAERIYEKCDRVDGLADGLIDDPRRCQFDPATDVPRCSGAAGESACLSDAQVSTLRAIYGGVTAKGSSIFPGFPVGAEARMQSSPAGLRSGWLPWIISEGQQPISLQFAESFFKEMVTPGTPIDWREFDPDRDLDKLGTIATLLNATSPDLARFKARGGKILMYFGWADPGLNPMMGVNYYEQVRKTDADAHAFFRLFMMPGVLHCTGGIGPSAFDSIAPLVDWVERGAAPDRLVASLKQGSKTVRSRPLCAYPNVARYKGTGSIDEAENFACLPPPGATSSAR